VTPKGLTPKGLTPKGSQKALKRYLRKE